jgi:hypothetical protein
LEDGTGRIFGEKNGEVLDDHRSEVNHQSQEMHKRNILGHTVFDFACFTLELFVFNPGEESRH